MWCANFSRREYSPRCSITDFFQFSDDLSEPKADVSFDVLEETHGWPANPNSVCDPRPEMSWVVLAKSLPCGAEWLARVASREDVHFAAKLLPREGLKIRPDRCRVQESRFHFSDQVRAGERFDLAKSDCSQIWDCSLKSEINAAVPGAEANVCNWFGSIHVMCGCWLGHNVATVTRPNCFGWYFFRLKRFSEIGLAVFSQAKLFSGQNFRVKNEIRNWISEFALRYGMPARMGWRFAPAGWRPPAGRRPAPPGPGPVRGPAGPPAGPPGRQSGAARARSNGPRQAPVAPAFEQKKARRPRRAQAGKGKGPGS
jgi:hypothetical protein